MTPPIYLPPGAAVKPTASPIKHQNPFEQITKNVRQMGFDIKARHDAQERVIEVLFTPTTGKTLQACKVAAGSSQATGLKTMVTYGVLDDPFYATVACIEKGLEELKQAL